ncbi:hypothetical protein Cfor_06104 [Coptotermes formosanus]|uniref:Very-long-chain (3R)-3-hydroxyacyl-CoA dehydratase n=1 Tax=Coptotermes formosanus TaxID=36987 RepID=A0A6L2Q3G9_COPFO|nr:hypothetical protein Cfor_06104 [Coptotermes formosanus]
MRYSLGGPGLGSRLVVASGSWKPCGIHWDSEGHEIWSKQVMRKGKEVYGGRRDEEVVHAATNVVPSSVVITLFQVLSRVMLVCGVLLPTPTGPASPGLPLALIAWSITEVIRYLYYVLNLLGAVPYLLVWCRYTFFTVLYPVGVTGELLCLYAAQSYVAKTKLWSLEMPNKLNVTFSYHYFLLFTMLLYIPVFPQMYLHMFTQRQKVMAVSTGKKVK